MTSGKDDDTTSADDEELARQDAILERRVIFSMIVPAIRISALRTIPLKEMTNLLRLAYFRQLRNRGQTLREISEVLNISVRTAKRLSQQLKENFFAPEVEHELPRRIEFMLWATPMTRARINQVIEDATADEIARAFDQLVEQERVHEVSDRPGYYAARRPGGTRISGDSMIARVGGLNVFLNNVTNAIHGRFFSDDPASFVRTVTFRVRERDLHELRELYEQVLWKKLGELEERVPEDASDDALELQFSICWAPYELDEEN